MIRKKLRVDFVAAAALTMFVAGAVVAPTSSEAVVVSPPAASLTATASQTAEDIAGRSYTVQLADPPLASYRGTLSSLAAPPRKASGKLDVTAPESRAYVAHLKDQQRNLLNRAKAELGRDVKVNFSYTNAINGVSIQISAAEADKLAKLPGVRSVRRNTSHLVQTDSGPAWIGAPGVWNGTTTGGLPGTRGEGMLIADIDSGIAFANPAFAATGGDGYTVVNPYGAGTYLGTCAVGGIEAGKCNDKLIGAYDFIYDIACEGGTCPTGYSDSPGAFDQNGHGSHTASTIAGNVLTAAPILGTSVAISGVAPHANIIAYQVCITIIDPASANYGSASCYSESSVAAVDQAIADGADAINFSIGGGDTPWDDDVSLAFLNAVDAGIFVSASAGNSGPTASTVSHREPWTIGVAAMTHDRLFSDTHATVTGPTPVPTNLAFLQGVNSANDGPQVTGPVTGPLKLSTNNPANDACTANGGFTGGGAAGFIAVIQRGSCNFSEKVANATTAGAAGVIIFNNSGAAPLIMSVPSTTKPSMMISNADGLALKAFLTANANATGTIDRTTPPTFSHNPSFGDITAQFSSRGPNTGFALMKPEIGGPGVSILAAYSGSDTLVDPTAGNFAFLQGTSMSSPHVAGSGMLVRKLHPTWTPMEVKSALMLTAKNTNLFAENGTTPATPNEVGAGRVDVSRAARSPLVMNESATKMLQADPGATPAGDPSKLNVASLDSLSCGGTCTFTRTVRSVASGPITFNASYTGSAGSTATITPNSFTILPGTTKTLTIAVNASAVPVGTYAFGNVNLVPTVNGDDIIFRDGFDGAPAPAAALSVHMPVAVRSSASVQPPNIVVAPTALTANQQAGTTTTQSLSVSNTGGQPLVWTTVGGSAPAVVAQQATGGTNGIISGDFVASSGGVYSADDFVISASTPITELFIDGFANSADLTTTASSVSFYIYPNAGGVPAGNPEDGLNLQTWKYTANIGSAGLSVTNDQITLNLAAAGAPALTLAAGTYWIVVAPTQNLAFNATTRWNWYIGTPLGSGSPAKLIDPNDFFAGGATSWTDITALTGNAAFGALNYRISGSVPCGAPWLSISPTNATTAPAGNTPTTVTFNATGLAAGTYNAKLCFTSNDTAHPTVVVPVTLTVTPSGPTPPTVTKAFAPTSVAIATNSTATITLANTNATAATLSANLVDTLPSGLVATAGTAATTCTGGTATIAGGGGSVTLSSGASIPASGSCTVTFTVQAAAAGGFTNTIAAGALQTSAGNNATAGSATLTVGGGSDVTVNYDFEDVASMFSTGGWRQQNTSSPLGAATFAQGTAGTGAGTSGIESAQAGTINSFGVVNYTSTTGAGTISNWMMTPVITFSATGEVSFWTRVPTGSEFPDRLEVRVSTAGSSVNVGTSPATVGDFTTVLTTINPSLTVGGYPEVWTKYTFASAQGLPTSGTGRVAFRYYVTNGGPSGDNSNIIGFDTVQIKAAAVATSASPQPVQSVPESANAR